jgi:hypothetical protein
LDPRREKKAWFSMHNASLRGMPLTFVLDDPTLDVQEITWEITVEDGYFYLPWMDSPVVDNGTAYEHHSSDWDTIYVGQSYTFKNGKSIHWNNVAYVDAVNDSFTGKLTYLKAIVRANGNIIGYASVVITSGNGSYREGSESNVYIPLLVACEYFAPIDGKFQDISLENIESKIADAKADRASFVNQYLTRIWGDSDY